MKTKTTYVANDGKEFSNYKECKQYEEEKANLKQYHVDITFAAYADATVTAKNREEAKEKALKYVRKTYYLEDFCLSDEPVAIVITTEREIK